MPALLLIGITAAIGGLVITPLLGPVVLGIIGFSAAGPVAGDYNYLDSNEVSGYSADGHWQEPSPQACRRELGTL
jgi:hypothetical protein